MSQGSSFREKIDTLDLVITVLKDHEKILDNLAKRLEPIVDGLISRNTEEEKIREGISSIERKISGLNDILARFLLTQTSVSAKTVSIECREWETFKTRSIEAHTVTYDVENKAFIVNSTIGNELYTYLEALPEYEFTVKRDGERFLLEEFSISSLDNTSLLNSKILKCGLDISIETSRHELSEGKYLFKLLYKINDDWTKRWLSKELKIPEENILRGKITV